MIKLYSVLLLMFITTAGALKAQTSITSVDQTYNQDFNTLASSGSSNSFSLSNWTISRETYNGNDGAGNTGTIYSYGTTGSSERALGSLNSGNTPKLYFGTSFKNESGSNIGKISITYTGEQWRNGTKNILGVGTLLPDSLIFQYSLNASSAIDSNASWTSVNALTFISPTLLTVEGKLDGNASEHKTTLSAELGIVLIAGQTLTIRWANERSISSQVVGSRDGLAIDDLSVTFGEGEIVTPCTNPGNFFVNTVYLNVSGTTIDASFEAVEGAVGYLVLLDDIQDLDETTYEYGYPENGTEYIVGNFINNSEIINAGTETTTSISNLKPENTYKVTVYPIFDCEEGFVYGKLNSNQATTPISTRIKNNVLSKVLIYPNPVSENVLNLRLSAATQGKANVQIFNVLGAQVFGTQEFISSNTQLRLPNSLPAGRYTLRIEQDGVSQIGSFIVVK